MHLNMTSIQDAWGVSDLGAVSQENPYSLPEVQKEHLSSHLVPVASSVASSIASSIASHPNSIVETRPTRMDVALYCPKVIEELFPKSEETRTNIVTDLIRAAFFTKKQPEARKLAQEKKEYFEVSEEENQTDNMTVLMLLTFVLILIDKLFNIWKNS